MKILRIICGLWLGLCLTASGQQVNKTLFNLTQATNFGPNDLLLGNTGTVAHSTRTITLNNLLSSMANLPNWPTAGTINTTNLVVSNIYGPFITNFYLFSTNIFTTNLYSTNLIANNTYTTNLYGPFITNFVEYSTNLYVTTNYVTQQFVTNEQVNISYVTNQYVTTSIVTNLYVTTNYNNTSFITNEYVSISYITNLTAGKVTVNNLFTGNQWFTTNAFPSATNTFDLTNSFQWINASTSVSITNLNSVSNNFVGLGMLLISNTSGGNITFTWNVANSVAIGAQTLPQLTIGSGKTAWCRILTWGNVFTNYADDLGDGTLATQAFANNTTNRAITISGTANQVSVAGSPVVLGATATISLPSPLITPGNLSSAQITNTSFAASGVVTNDANGKTYTTPTIQNALLANSSITIQGSAVALGGSTLAAGSSPSFNAVNFTNWNGSIPTNNGAGAALVFGGPSTATASILYDTNITVATTLASFDISHTPNTASGIKLYVTCSGGTDRILTFPNGCTSAGYGLPPAITITNSKAAWFDIIYKPGATPATNVFWSPVF